MGRRDPHDSLSQLSLSFEPGLAQRHGSLRQCLAAGIYQRGLTRVAGQVDVAPSKLSEKLAGGVGDRKRDVGLDEFERYLDVTGDHTPVLYLVDKYLSSREAQREERTARLTSAVETLLAELRSESAVSRGRR